MRKQRVLKILKKYDLVPHGTQLWQIGMLKNLLWDGVTWKKFLWLMCFSAYIQDELPDEGIIVEELGDMQFGGSITVDLR